MVDIVKRYCFLLSFVIVSGVTFQFYLDANSKNLPVEVAIDTGYYGSNRKSSLYEEQLTLNFEMKLHVVRGKVDHGATYHIPLASSLQFSLLHNPSDNLQQAMLGHYFETVGHILAQPSRSRPTVIICMRACIHVCMWVCVCVCVTDSG